MGTMSLYSKKMHVCVARCRADAHIEASDQIVLSGTAFNTTEGGFEGYGHEVLVA